MRYLVALRTYLIEANTGAKCFSSVVDEQESFKALYQQGKFRHIYAHEKAMTRMA
jgi:hypothetical protein